MKIYKNKSISASEDIASKQTVNASVLYELLDDEYEHIGGWYDDEQEARFAALNICEDNPQIQFLSIRRYNDADDDGEIIDEIESEYYIEESIRIDKSKVQASRKPAPKRAIKASNDSDDIVMYWDGQKVYEGPIMRDFVDKVNWFLDDPEKLQEIVDYCNSFGDPLIEDASDTFDVASTFAEVVGWEQGEAEAIDDDFYVSDEAGHFEIFPKSREVEGSVQRRAKKSVKASNNKRGDNAMKLQKRKSITCAGDDYKVKMLREFLDKMNLNNDNWAYVQVKCNGKAINLDEGAVNLLIDYYTNAYDPKKDAYSSEFVGASRKPAPRRRTVKASTYGDAFEDIERSKDAYIQRWSEEYEGTPATSWDNIFDNVLEEFTRYADDESSGFILEKFENGEYTADDMDNEFEQYIMWRDLGEYDQD